MIELRWAQRVGRNPKAGPRTVLQWREGDYPYADRKTGEPINEWCGTEWKDVPTVWLGRSNAASLHHPQEKP